MSNLVIKENVKANTVMITYIENNMYIGYFPYDYSITQLLFTIKEKISLKKTINFFWLKIKLHFYWDVHIKISHN